MILSRRALELWILGKFRLHGKRMKPVKHLGSFCKNLQNNLRKLLFSAIIQENWTTTGFLINLCTRYPLNTLYVLMYRTFMFPHFTHIPRFVRHALDVTETIFKPSQSTQDILVPPCPGHSQTLISMAISGSQIGGTYHWRRPGIPIDHSDTGWWFEPL